MLTELQCKALKPKDKKYRITDSGGLYIEVHPAGGKYWFYKYFAAKKEKRLSIGKYPLVSLKEARAKRDDAKKLLSDGIDPSQEKRKVKITLHTQFEHIALEWLEFKKHQWEARTFYKEKGFVTHHLIPQFKGRDIDSIGAKEFLQYIQQLNANLSHTARRVAETASCIFRYAIVTHGTKSNPSSAIMGLIKYKQGEHFARISFDELPQFIELLESNKARLYHQTIAAIKLLMHTMVRTGELIVAEWGEFNLSAKEWHIPASRMKMRKAHIVPLSNQVLAILETLRVDNIDSPYILPSPAKPQQPISNNTVLKALERMGYKGRMTGHGFRGLGLTSIKEQLGYSHEIVDRALAHAPKGMVNQAYDDAVFLEKRRTMMQDWSNLLSSLRSNTG